MIHYAIAYPGVTPPTMTTGDLEEVVFSLFPRHPSSRRRETQRRSSKHYVHFGSFTSRVYQLPQARLMLARLTPQAARGLEQALQDPANFGMAKSFVLMGKEAGFDMESPEGMRAWVEAYNATVAPRMAAASRHPESPTNQQSHAVPKGTRNAPRRKRKPTSPRLPRKGP
jgi:hypothetical protein